MTEASQLSRETKEGKFQKGRWRIDKIQMYIFLSCIVFILSQIIVIVLLSVSVSCLFSHLFYVFIF